MTEETTEDGERVGYIDLFDPARGATVDGAGSEDTKFVTESQARRLAEERAGFSPRLDQSRIAERCPRRRRGSKPPLAFLVSGGA
jgi:hypothetical protein